jgi:hypothetical protein
VKGPCEVTNRPTADIDQPAEVTAPTLTHLKFSRMPHGGIDAMIDDSCGNPINLRQDAVR